MEHLVRCRGAIASAEGGHNHARGLDIWLTALLLFSAGLATGRSQECQWYPITLSEEALANVAPGTTLSDLLQGTQPGSFGWLTWAGSPSEPTLVTSLAAPGNSSTYVNPDNPFDQQLSLGDWVRGKPGVSNGRPIRDALEALTTTEIIVPVWNETRGKGEHTAYRVSAFARVRLLNFQLPQQNRITAQFLGFTSCANPNQAPAVSAGPDLSVGLSTPALLAGSVIDDGLPLAGMLTQSWSKAAGPGTVTFNDATTPVTTATFSVAGTYLLRLTASDSQVTTSDETVVLVNRENLPPVAYDQSVTNDEDALIILFLQSSDPDGDILTNILIRLPDHGTLTGTPPHLSYTPAPDYNGSDSFQFKANDGTLDSGVATVTITNRPINDPPMVNAEAVGTLEDLSLALILSGSDVEGSPLTFTLLSTPTNGTLNRALGTLVSPELSYLPATNYHGSDSFTFAASDGVLTSVVATISITVTSINDSPIVSAGPDQLINWPSNSVELHGSIDDAEFLESEPLTAHWIVVSGAPGGAFANPETAVTTATFPTSGVYRLRLTADDSFYTANDEVIVTVNQPPSVSVGSGVTNTLPATFILNGMVSDDGLPTNGTLNLEWSKVSGPPSSTAYFAQIDATNTTVAFSQSGLYLLEFKASDGAASSTATLSALANRAPVIDAGSDQTNDTSQIILNGTVADDGFPEGIAAAPLWTKVSGPGDVFFNSPTDPRTTVIFSQVGIYVLRLSADDSLATGSDEITITLIKPNQAPHVEAGQDQLIVLPETASLRGVVVDDGLPEGALVTFHWSSFTGLGEVAFASASHTNTIATFTIPGNYTLRLTSTDGVLTNFDDVRIAVRTPAMNQAPVINAGPDKVVGLTNTATLSGVVTDDAMPRGNTLAMFWSFVSGPGTVVFENPNTASARATFSTLGTYVLRLSASDGALTNDDDVTITVYPFNQPPSVEAGANQTILVPDPAVLSATTNGIVELSRSLSSVARWNNTPGLPGLSGVAHGIGSVSVNRNGLALENGILSVAGAFTNAGGVYAKSLARYDGTNWANYYDTNALPYTNGSFLFGSTVGWLVFDCGTAGFCNEGFGSVAARGNELFASGAPYFKELETLSDPTADITARWDGTRWRAWDFNLLSGSSGLIKATPGKVFVGGINLVFQPTNDSSHGFLANLPVGYGLAVWDGTNWGTLGQGIVDLRDTPNSTDPRWKNSQAVVTSIALGRTGEVFVAGDFLMPTPTGVASNIAKWNGEQWTPLSSGLRKSSGGVHMTAMALTGNGDLYVGGTFTNAGGVALRNVARWDGAQWHPLGQGAFNGVNSSVEALALHGNDLYAGGAFSESGGFTANRIARWNGQFWTPLGAGPSNGVNGLVLALAADDVSLYVGGLFTRAGGLAATNLARWEFPELPKPGVLLHGLVTDDGLPMDSTLALHWTQVSGPGPATFSAPTNAISHATFSAIGTYVLRLAATDSELTGGDEVTLEVLGNQPPSVDGGPGQTVGFNETFTLAGAVNDDGLPENASIVHVWSVVTTPVNGIVTFLNPGATNTTARITGATGLYLLRLTANDSHFSTHADVVINVAGQNLAPSVNLFSFTASVILPNAGFAQSLVQDDGLPSGITNIFWSQVNGPAPVAFSNANAVATPITFTTAGSYRLRLAATDSQLTGSQEFIINVTGPTQPSLSGNTAPVVQAGADFTAFARRSIQLHGAGSDDGLPAGSTVTKYWGVVSGIDRVYFDDSRQTNATAIINTPGTYVLRLAANDGQLSAYDDVTITVVAPTNDPPLTYAGPDIEITRPQPAELFGFAVDDGLPLGAPVAASWSIVSGPGSVTFTPNANDSPSHATFSAPGIYVLRFTASDTQFTDTDEITITVHEGTNAAPFVNAGSDLAVALPSLAILSGSSATDDGLPQGTLTVSWSQVSGPAPAQLSSVNGIYQAAFNAAGTYVLRLTADDTELTSADDVTVTVHEAGDSPAVAIHTPLDAAIITAPTVVTGTVSSVLLQSWSLQYRRKPAGLDQLETQNSKPGTWISLSTGTTSLTAAALATFDPTLLLNGIYEVQLIATDIVARTSTTEPITLIVDRNMKVGHFTVSFNDLTIPVAGIPLQVTRTYDSRDKSMGDFGIGWTLDLKNIRLQKNRHLGRAWDQTSTGGLFPTYCIDTTKPRVVTITFPDGKVQTFQATLAPFCQALSPLIYPDMTFAPLANTFGTLTPLFELNGEFVPDEQLVWGGSVPDRADFISYERLLNPPPGPADAILFNPDLFEFTTIEGFRYVISETNGLRRATDPNGNTLVVTTNGLTWSNPLSASGGEGQGETASLSILFQRDLLGRITNIVDALGHAITYRYDTNGNLVTFTDRDGNTNQFTYDGRSSLLTVTDSRGVQTLGNDYDTTGRVLRSADSLGNSVGYSYDLANQRSSVTNRLGFVTVKEFDSHGNIVRTINPLGSISSFVYDENDNLLVKSNANACACAVTYTYDAFDNRISETDGRGNITTYSYNGLRRILTTTEPSGFGTTNTYDTRGNLLSTFDSAGQLATFTYNTAGKVITLTDPKGNVSRFAYNALGFLTNEVNALGHVTEYEVDAAGNQLSQAVTWSQVSALEVAQAHRRAQGWMEAATIPTPVTVVAGTNTLRLVMRHEYSPSGQPLRTLYYDGSSTETHYNQIGKKEQSTDQLGRTTSYNYNQLGLVESINHPGGCNESFDYDAEGQLLSSTDRRGFETHFTYDPAGKLINTRFADGAQVSATYFADGSLRSETAKNGEVTLYEIDANGNRTSVSNSVGITRYTYNYKKFATSKVDPLGRTNLYEYDALGRNTRNIYPNGTSRTATFSGKLLDSETDQNGRTTTFHYDALGRLLALTNAEGEVTRSTYDELGNKNSETDPLGRTTFFEHDAMRRLVRTVYPDGSSIGTQFDAGGRALARFDQEANVTRFGYDAADNVTSVTNASGGITRFSYDCSGNKLSQIDPDGRTTEFAYDRLGRLTRILLPCGVSEATDYDVAGRVTAKTDANAQTTRFAYDLRNNLIASVEPLNRTNFFTYDAAGNRLTEITANGQVTIFTYDDGDRLVQMIHPDGTKESFTHDGTGRFLSHTDQAGKTSTFENDHVGRLIAVTDPLGHVTHYGYDANGNRIAETNANNLVTRHEYDELSRPTRTIYPDGSTIAVDHDRLGRRVSETDAAGHTTLFAYDELSRLTGRQDHLGNITRFGYDAVGRMTSQTDANNQTTTFDYDCLGRRNRILSANGTAQHFAYDNAGRRLSETDANTNSTKFAYDSLGRLVATTNALGHVTQFNYDPLDRLIARTDPLGRTTTFEYDALGRRTRTLHPDGATETAGYDAKGRRVRQTDSAGHSTFFAYDDADHLISITNALGQSIGYVYDATGRLTAETDALGRITSFEYDALDRLTRTVYSDGTARSTDYDLQGRRIRDTDPANVATTYGHDAIGRLSAVTNALGEATLYGYDSVGRLVAQTNANGQATTFAYDPLGRRILRTLPGGQSEAYGYDPAGNLTHRTNSNGHTTRYTYDALNRVTAKTPDAQLLVTGSVPVTYSYNAVGLRTNMTDAAGVTDYVYDQRDRLAMRTTQWALLPVPTTLTYRYDTNGNLAAIRSSNPNGTEVTYTNDALNRLSVVQDSRLGPTTYDYDPVGNLQRFTRPNSVQSTFQYDSLYRLTNLAVSGASGLLANYEYAVGPTGHRLRAVEALSLSSQPSTIYRSYGYDSAYRLTTEVIQLGTTAQPAALTYTYDPAGNRLTRSSELEILSSQSFTYDANDRLLSDRYDANGNTTNAFVTPPLSGLTHEVFDRFDFEDRLFERQTTVNAQPSTIQLLHDGDGNRVAKTVTTGTNTFTTLYVVDDLNPTGYAQVLEELTSSNGEPFAVTRVYTWGDALISDDQFVSNQWSASFPGHDGHGNVRFHTDPTGHITDTLDYDAFGNLIARSPTSPLPPLTSHLFSGEQFDSDLNLYYLRARYHNPASGRFWTADSFAGFPTDPASLHRYTFNQNDPVNRFDPSGHISLTESLEVAGLAPMVRGTVLGLWEGVNQFSHGMAGGNALKFTTREEAYFIDSLAAGPGWKFGKENFWATVRGAPFLLSPNPNIWQGRKPCWYDCLPFDQDIPVYGPGAVHPVFEFGESPLFGLAEKIGHFGTSPVRFIGGAAVAGGVAGKGVKDLLVNTGGAVSYGIAAGVYGPESAERFFGQQADATAALATGLGRVGIASASLAYQPLLSAIAPEFATEQRDLLGTTAQGAVSSFTGGDLEFGGLGWEFRAGFTAFNLLGLVQGGAELTHALQTAKAARTAARFVTAETAGESSALRALRINEPAAEAAEAAAALAGPAQAGCRVQRPPLTIALAEATDGSFVPVSELKNQRLIPAPAVAQSGVATVADQAVFWSGRQGLNKVAAEASGTTLGNTPAGIALESQDHFATLPYSEAIKLWDDLSEQFASQAKGTVRAWTGGASPMSVWKRIELPALLRNPEVKKILIHDAEQPWRTKIIYK
jgi:RHS repeat-associated protein